MDDEEGRWKIRLAQMADRIVGSCVELEAPPEEDGLVIELEQRCIRYHFGAQDLDWRCFVPRSQI